ncbi:DUF1707 SHOCT-like domain-containing protein [Tessaracoccus antarcticus]|uniref:DUF1707 SHOCT-like domain-containing protein n=1 Tax=Tessaracoccus antarcticus TaxID=2479848 RepID=UPI001314DD62|nr:DUF1707 domain-containing protein [Tessaracoccus antarcticus]
MSAQDHPGGIGHLRCSDGDRELVADVLGRAFSEGRITFEEHDERLNHTYAARTFAELDAITTDLVAPSEAPTPAPLSAHVPERRFSGTPATGTVLHNSTTVMTTLNPGAPLHIPQETSLMVILGTLKLDLVNATFAAETVHINISNLMGDVRIRVPEGIRVVNSISNIMGDYKAKNVPVGPASVTVELHGTMVMGQVTVLGPGGRPGKYERFVR